MPSRVGVQHAHKLQQNVSQFGPGLSLEQPNVLDSHLLLLVLRPHGRTKSPKVVGSSDAPATAHGCQDLLEVGFYPTHSCDARWISVAVWLEGKETRSSSTVYRLATNCPVSRKHLASFIIKRQERVNRHLQQILARKPTLLLGPTVESALACDLTGCLDEAGWVGERCGAPESLRDPLVYLVCSLLRWVAAQLPGASSCLRRHAALLCPTSHARVPA